MKSASLILVGATALLGLASLAGCGAGDVVNADKTEIAVRYDVEHATGVTVAKVGCPERVPVRPGTRFTCEVTTRGGDRALAELEVLTDRADLRLVRLRKH